ncbi:MAG: hypothetical protein HN737_11165 [Desulfobacterales bacterium]|nr:hypothetical protein [Desulfobacteraceae bacterium]MBT4364337.1 hypothetical protein [Desulfobacteraceae bacterium]MBT7085797.1 hypothetical protein [Desulfobacterales bacterium]MBT7697955.1 hypothetical protein [Desulfobacterales bacterium]
MQLSKLVKTDTPKDILNEALIIIKMTSSTIDNDRIMSAFSKTVDLFQGRYPGYRSCNTEYHDLKHTTQSFLTMASLLHGASCNNEIFTDSLIILSLIMSLLHDSGYIQEEDDNEGTGAKHTLNHVQRSIDFVKKHGDDFGLADDEIENGGIIILCTDLSVNIKEISFPSSRIELLAKMLGAADLLAQMADRAYLEKLLFLYYEFKEAGLGGYKSEIDLLRETIGFFDFIEERLEKVLDSTDLFMDSHFTSRWNIDRNLYRVSIENQKKYLQQIFENPDLDPLEHLKRDGIVNRAIKKGAVSSRSI